MSSITIRIVITDSVNMTSSIDYYTIKEDKVIASLSRDKDAENTYPTKREYASGVCSHEDFKDIIGAIIVKAKQLEIK